MKTIFTIIFCISAQTILAQKKIKKEELKRFDWKVYNTDVSDSLEVFLSDTLELIKTYDYELDEDAKIEDDKNISSNFSKCWELRFFNTKTVNSVESNEFELFYIDLRQAAIKRKLMVDSLSFEILYQSPNDLNFESSEIQNRLDNLEPGDYIEIVDTVHQKNFHLLKLDNSFRVYDSMNGQFIYYPKGVSAGFWSLSGQKLVFSNRFGNIQFEYQVQRIDKTRIRLIKVQMPDFKN